MWSAGYVNSGAIIPDQEVRNGVIEVRIIEGRLVDIVVNGLTSLKPEFVEERIRQGAGPPLNVNDLRTRIQLLLLDPAIDRINARLGPGLRPGEGRFEVIERDAIRFDFARRSTMATPLGSGALAGLSWNLDRSATAEGARLRATIAELDRRRLEPRLRAGLPGTRPPSAQPICPASARSW